MSAAMLTRLLGVIAATVAAVPLTASPASAAVQRTYVSTDGSDANSCSRALPCRSFNAAIAKTESRGVVVAVDSGGYGPVTVDKAVTLAGAPGAHVAINASSGNAIQVVAGADDRVVLRHLYLNNLGTGGAGIGVLTGNALSLEDIVISDWIVGIGITSSAPDARLEISHSMLRGSLEGVSAGAGGENRLAISVDHTRFYDGRGGGAALIFNGAVNAAVTDSVVSNNDGPGFSVGPGARLSLERVVSSFNLYGILAAGSGRAIASNTTITGNDFGLVSFNGGQLVSRSNNTVEDNGVNGSFTGTVAAKLRAAPG